MENFRHSRELAETLLEEDMWEMSEDMEELVEEEEEEEEEQEEEEEEEEEESATQRSSTQDPNGKHGKIERLSRRCLL